MTLEALLTFIGIIAAVYGIARPVQRHSLTLFVPVYWLAGALVLSFFLIFCRDAPFGVKPPFGWSLPVVLFSLTVASFLIPVGAAFWSGLSWHRAKLTGKRIERVENIFQTALREREFDEVERIIRKNQRDLGRLPAGAAYVLFDPAMVAALMDSHSQVHLELLADMGFLKSLKNRFGAVDVVVRKLLRSDTSPLRSAVVATYGGLEHRVFSDTEETLIESTFQNPDWYVEASAHYPLVISAVEELQSGQFDSRYNDVGRGYETQQGISTRSRCPIYLALKTEVLAIDAALKKRDERDFYVSDLLDIFRRVQERSKFTENVWEGSTSNPEFPTPYAYLLYEIAADFRNLSANALETATTTIKPSRIEAPGKITRALAQNWSFGVWSIADSKDQVSQGFRRAVIEDYLLFVLALHSQPNEIYPGAVRDDLEGLHVWRDLFLQELKLRFLGKSDRREALEDAFESLDQGKGFVGDGYEWLEQELFEDPPPAHEES